MGQKLQQHVVKLAFDVVHLREQTLILYRATHHGEQDVSSQCVLGNELLISPTHSCFVVIYFGDWPKLLRLELIYFGDFGDFTVFSVSGY